MIVHAHQFTKEFFFFLCFFNVFLIKFVLFPLNFPRASTFGKMSYLQPMDTRQYLYCLKPKPEYAEKAGVIKGVTVIGKLDIVWKTNLGERGRLQTSQLQRMVGGSYHSTTATENGRGIVSQHDCPSRVLPVCEFWDDSDVACSPQHCDSC